MLYCRQMEPTDALGMAVNIIQDSLHKERVMDEAALIALKAQIRDFIVRYSTLPPEKWDLLAQIMLERLKVKWGLKKKM